MSNFGHTLSGTRDSGFSGHRVGGGAFSVGGTLTDINLHCAGWGGTGNIRVRVYAINATTPTGATLIKDTGTLSLTVGQLPATWANRALSSWGVSFGQTLPASTHLFIVVESQDHSFGLQAAGAGDLTDLSGQSQDVSALFAFADSTGSPSTFPTYSSGGNAEQAMVQLVFTAAGAALAGTPSDTAAATGALSVPKPLAAAAADVAAAAAALIAAIKLAVNAADTAVAVGQLQGQALLQGQAADAAAAGGNITTGITPTGSAVDASSSTAALTNWTTVTLTSPLYTGVGSIADPNGWLSASRPPGVGDTIYYDATHITIETNGEITSDVNSTSAVAQFNSGSAWELTVMIVTPFSVGYALDSAAATGGLSTAITLVGAAQVAASVSVLLSTAIEPQSNAVALSSASANLSAQIMMLGDAHDSAVVTGSIVPLTQLFGAAIDLVTASALLNVNKPLDAHAADVATAIANLNTAIAMAGSAIDATVAAAILNSHLAAASVRRLVSMKYRNRTVTIH